MLQAAVHKFRVLYVVTRAEYYEVEATTEEEARKMGFLFGVDIKAGETVDVIAVEAERVSPEDSASMP